MSTTKGKRLRWRRRKDGIDRWAKTATHTFQVDCVWADEFTLRVYLGDEDIDFLAEKFQSVQAAKCHAQGLVDQYGSQIPYPFEDYWGTP